ncbi:hypothetical protein A3C37_02270 [Candidatus Peribacteria bacterium RIFCSPHIGHO2_02_FULL_53_20]|nr:MAG: hypothetical protein A3C37_02270 [Candidatus Peribacteria bacterium RIFCSPHIGHO2_02_FULL_53_20]OGJ65882.1 MAG: hypothetical protein A3B61_03915 [Candidatus Peribacteria bacterium RIFCSPLOWO2_01_FULL_53_10]OGJ69851.1 MAG: hypothetical protein A3G69_00235 [Candidatus Peribacteria bacterium RIFCSPLOWO2_12_FULL_53_10]
MYTVVLTSKAKKQFLKLQDNDKKRVRLAMLGIAEDPTSGKILKGDFKGMFCIRVWPYRIIYILEKKIVTVTIVSIGHRKDVYKKLKR